MTETHATVTRLGDHRTGSAQRSGRPVHVTHDEAGPLFVFTRLAGFLVSNEISETFRLRDRVESTIVRVLPAPPDHLISKVELAEPEDSLTHTPVPASGRHLTVVG